MACAAMIVTAGGRRVPFPPMTATELAVLGFAAFRLTRLVTEDTLLDRPRAAVGRRFPPDTFLGTLVSCHWCAGVWLSAGLLGLQRTGLGRTVTGLLAIAGLQGLLGAAGDALSAASR